MMAGIPGGRQSPGAAEAVYRFPSCPLCASVVNLSSVTSGIISELFLAQQRNKPGQILGDRKTALAQLILNERREPFT